MGNSKRSVGERIAYYRKLQGLTQKELGALAGVRQERLSNIETGIKGVPLSRLARIAWALGMSLKDLLGDMEEEK